MGELKIFGVSKDTVKSDILHFGKKKIHGYFTAIKFIDKDTHQWVYYIPSFEVSGYGNTYEKAEEMVKFSLNELFEYLTKLSSRKRQEELQKLGWKKDSMFNKEFKQAYGDMSGKLKNFNADEKTVERLTLVA